MENKELIFTTSAAAIRTDAPPKVGTACSVEKFYYCNHTKEQRSFSLAEVESVNYEGKNRSGSYSLGDKITVRLKNGEEHILAECMIGLDGLGLAKLLTAAATNAIPITDPSMTRRLSLHELSHQLQINYMEALYNYAYISDCQVDSTEYAALQSIIVRIGLDASARNELRDYLFRMQQGARVKTGVLIERCRNAMSYGSYEIFRYSLMQDALYLREASGADTPWFEDPFLNGLQKMLEINDEQVQTMLSAISLYKAIQTRDADLTALKGEQETLWRHAKENRIPQEALFCSGSVYSVDTYFRWHRSRKLGRSITRQRELMLQAVIRNTQQSLNHLVEDMNDITLKLVDEVQRGNQRDEQIQQLSQRIVQFQRQAKAMVQKSDETNATRLYNRLPARVSKERVMELVPQQRELVEECYTPLSQEEYQIKPELSVKLLTMLCQIRGIMGDE